MNLLCVRFFFCCWFFPWSLLFNIISQQFVATAFMLLLNVTGHKFYIFFLSLNTTSRHVHSYQFWFVFMYIKLIFSAFKRGGKGPHLDAEEEMDEWMCSFADSGGPWDCVRKGVLSKSVPIRVRRSICCVEPLESKGRAQSIVCHYCVST